MYAELERKICTVCKIEKELDKFTKRSSRPSGKASWCKDCLNGWRREYKKQNKQKYSDYEKNRGLQRNYGITAIQYDKMLEEQDGKCACCGIHSREFKRLLHVDHDHASGEIRLLLCTRCNPGIGYFDHSIERLEQAIAYLKKFKK